MHSDTPSMPQHNNGHDSVDNNADDDDSGGADDDDDDAEVK